MSEVQSRPARGRSSARGGRGGQASRGPRSNKQTNGEAAPAPDTSADQGELGELKKRYLNELATLKEMFPTWTDVDLVLALEDSDGDLPTAIDKITEGKVSRFDEVKKHGKDRSRSKAKEAGAPTDRAPSTRGAGRGRGGDSVRGRGRATDRGRGGFRGGRGAGATNGTRTGGAPSVPTTESSAWDVPAPAEPTENGHAKASAPPKAEPEAPQSTAAAVASGVKKTWASMFAAVPKSAAPKPAAKPAPPHEEPAPAVQTPAEDVAQEAPVEAEELPPIPPVAEEIAEELPAEIEETANLTPNKPDEPSGPELNLTPSKDELTKDNVEHLPDMSAPPPTETAASTVASSKDIGNLASVATPLSTGGQAPIGRPGIGGFQTTALKATSGSHRSASFQRRLMEQQEAVVMPGNHAVNQAAVQFGSLGLNGEADDSLDVDEDREEAETRTQPPQHSPVAQPRAALPPAPRQAPPTETLPQEIPTPKQAPGLPPAPQQQSSFTQQSPSGSLATQAMQSQGPQGRQSYDQFGRYGQGGIQPEAAAPQQKSSYDTFGQQGPQSSQYDYPNQQQNQQPSQASGFSSAPDAFASQYLTSDQQRSAYQNYYNYGQQGTPSQQEAGSAQQRTGSGFGAGPNDSTFSQSQQQQQVRPYPHWRMPTPAGPRPQQLGSQPTPSTRRSRESSLEQSRGEEVWKRIDKEENGSLPRHTSDKLQQAQSRYNDAQNSGHNTPNPALGGQHPTGPASQQGQQGQQGQHMHQPHAQTGNYPYNHPYYGSPYYANYVQQYGGYGQGGYGGFGKGMYAQHHPYGMSPQSSFDQHSSSPANAGGFGATSMHGREGGLGGGLGDYGRSVSGTSQNQHNPTAGSGGFGGLPDMFGRPQGGYGGQNSYGQQQGGQQGGNEDSLKPFGDKSAGPSPSALGAQPGRPGSATNNAPGQSGQGGIPQQSHQQGFGGYPSHLQGGQGNQYGGLGGLGHQGGGNHQQQQQQQQSAYGNYSGFGGGYGSYNRGGWGTNYGQH
ncbi:hypothetical protein K458DRAFT_386054 [Lentithecium fluviatile CBS 122367]|uniref:RNA polymerase II degradation factor 1 n=1 Tax=Lentithecium fluviatile CBS 122367 TaxID=1168545 RepID=A0A6G1JAR2_9PLEO|nr:hypothetical protein K458DRAFT_386054 [Lentithecium fluviatile CBS 122367]